MARLFSFSLLVFFSTSSLAAHGRRQLDKPTATIDSGPIIGTQTAYPDSPNPVVDKYLGIPFAAPAVRFKPPVPPQPWTEPLETLDYYPACMQQFSRNPEAVRRWYNTPAPPESEDCLALNVWAPAQDPGRKGWGDWHGKKDKGKAVLFWIYGGGLQFGTGSNAAYDGSSFAANQDVIVVTTNYRTNIFGFPDIPSLPVGENNLGFLDQRLALDWVQRNIAQFGGDPDRVTIFGQSAGGTSVDALVTAPPDPVPFHAAIYQSGQVTIRAPNPEPYAGWYATLNLTDCAGAADEIACVSAIDAVELETLISVNAVNFNPIPDDITLSSTTRQDRLTSTPSASKIARVPVLGGTVAEEGRNYALGINDTAAWLATTYPRASPDVLSTILQVFALGTPGIETVYDQVSSIITHANFQCTYSVVSRDMQTALIPSWRYFYNASFANVQLFEGSGVYHASEIQSVFGTVEANSTAFQFELSAYMQGTWADFAKDPHTFASWPPSPAIASLGGGIRLESGPQTGDLLTVVDQEVVDERCVAITPLYGI